MSSSYAALTITPALDLFLPCGHPGCPDNLLANGTCGTCEMARCWEELAASLKSNRSSAAAAHQIAQLFRTGSVVYDRSVSVAISEPPQLLPLIKTGSVRL